MINANELRIGNWITPVDLTGNKYTPIQVKSTTIYEIETGIFKANGIPLTTDILDRACISHEFFHDGVMIYKFGVFEYWCQKGRIWLNNDWNKFPNYDNLHQLQNLYFTLTCKELTINLNTHNHR